MFVLHDVATRTTYVVYLTIYLVATIQVVLQLYTSVTTKTIKALTYVWIIQNSKTADHYILGAAYLLLLIMLKKKKA